MRFICIYETGLSDWQKRIELLKSACEARGIVFVPVNAETFDLSTAEEWGQGDLVYRATRGQKAAMLERWLAGAACTTFYTDPLAMHIDIPSSASAAIVQRAAGAHGIPTLYGLPKDHLTLKQCAEKLGGFPLVVRALGGTHGSGVMKVDSIEALVSSADYLNTLPEQSFVMSRFIDHGAQARLIVLGDRVIASHENAVGADDFRSNAADENERQRSVKTYPAAIQAMAVAVVRAMGLEFGGVDILIDREGQPWIAEVNFPCYFPRTQEMTGINIAGLMVEHLIAKKPLS